MAQRALRKELKRSMAKRSRKGATRTPEIAIPSSVRFQLFCHADLAGPEECCGLLVGSTRRILAAIPMPNVAATPRTRFEVAPAAHIALRRILRLSRSRAQIVGVYHSHPAGPPIMSPSDLADAHYDDWVHLLVGDTRFRPRIRAFLVVDGRPVALKIRTA